VIIPAYNHARFLAATLDSALAQTWRPIEVIVVDDASTDDTREVLSAFAGSVRSVRLGSNCGGPARPRNIAISMSRGKYVALFDSDDLMHAGKLARQLEFLERYPDIPLVFSDFENWHPDGRVERFLRQGHDDFVQSRKDELGPREFRIPAAVAFDTLISDNYVGTSGIVMHRSLVNTVGGFDESLCNTDDKDFLFRVAHRFDLGFIDDVLHRRRLHAGNISTRPAALRAREIVYQRLRCAAFALSPAARARLDRRLAEVYFDRGYVERVGGSRALALKYYLKSWVLHRSDVRPIKSAIRALLPY
jgi:glycosyltransferase involved in cell wall biosynthesis